MDILVTPSSISGKVQAVASKSDAHRAIICAALADRQTEIFIPELSDDIKATLSCVEAMGAKIDTDNGMYTITPITDAERTPIINCGESGSTLRFLLPVATLICGNPVFMGEGRLPERPMDTIIDLLEEKGIVFSKRKLTFSTTGSFVAGRYRISGSVSSQFISGLLFALPILDGDSEIELSSPLESSLYVDMTINTLKRFSVNIIKTENGFRVPGNQKYISSGKYIVEGDWSGSSFMLVAGAFGKEACVLGLDINSTQSDKAILSVLKNAGADIIVENNIVTVRKSKLNAFSLDVSECPDIFPIAAILACGAKGESRLYNAKRLRFKESDRIEAVKNLIKSLGGVAIDTEDSLTIFGSGELVGGECDSVNDHRIAMSAAVASCICKEKVFIKGAQCINKSYPDFIRDFRNLGGIVDVI